MSVRESDAGILASDFCDASTDTTLPVDNWQPLPAAKQRETDLHFNLLLMVLIYGNKDVSDNVWFVGGQLNCI